MIDSLSKRNIIIKGCLFAAIIHSVFLCVDILVGHGDEVEIGSFRKKLVRERKQQETLQGHIPWKTPTMNTFFEPVPGGCCGASENGHFNLVATWEKAWQSKGWATKVLTLNDARKHPDFDKLKGVLDNLGVNEYNQRCFYRWLAMADIGGWMSDYDTVPLNFDAEIGAKISKYGIFTSFDSHVPSLISASKQEWERMLELMMTELQQLTKDDGFISDMVSWNGISNSQLCFIYVEARIIIWLFMMFHIPNFCSLRSLLSHRWFFMT